MKFSLTLAAAVTAAAFPLAGQAPAPLGNTEISVRAGYVVFSQGVTEDDGIYLGLAAYRRVTGSLYMGAEATAATTVTLFSDEMSLVPLELNAKYTRRVGSGFAVAGGGGLTLARARFHDERILAPDVTHEEWLFGGQAFADLVFRSGRFELGANAKYQLLQDPGKSPADFSNLRLGLQVGVGF